MENTAEALIMAGQILVFIIALSICMSSFSTLRENVSALIGETETIKMAKGSEGYINYVEGTQSKSTRVVGAETVVASMYRAVKENYIVYIKLNNYDGVEGTGTVLIKAKNEEEVAEKDGKDEGREVPGVTINPDDDLIKVTIGSKTNYINEMVNDILSNGLYDIIKDFKFNEYLGEYQNGTEASEENRVTKRIITYIQI